MDCPKCGNACPDDAGVCTQCGTSLMAEESSNGMPPQPSDNTGEPIADVVLPEPARKRTPRWLKATLGVSLCLVLIAVTGYAIVLKFFPPAVPLTAVIPENSPIIWSVDSVWAWKSIAPLRESPEFRKALETMEKESGLSLERDVIPWSGEVAAVVFDIKKDAPPSGLCLLQIRDRKAFLTHFSKLQSALEKKSNVTWEKYAYRSVPLRRAVVKFGDGKSVDVSAGTYGGWLALGFGKGTIEQSIDAWRGKTPSMRASRDWAKVLDKLPEQRCGFMALNGKTYGQMIIRQTPEMEGMLSFDSMMGYLMADAITERDHGLQSESFAVPVNDQVRNSWKEVKASLTPVQGAALQQLPDGAVAAIVSSNPRQVWEQGKKAVLGTLKNPMMAMSLTEGLKKIRPFEEVLNGCQGECGIALVQKNTADFGFAAVANTASPAAAAQAADKLQKALVGEKISVKKDGALYKIASLDAKHPGPVAFRWGAKESWLALASKPEFITGKAKTKLQLPQEAVGADMVFVANLSFLSPLYAKMEKLPGANPGFITALRELHMETMEYAAYTKFEQDGSMLHAVSYIRNWDWRKGLAVIPTIAKAVADESNNRH